jgi:hypothetical protein
VKRCSGAVASERSCTPGEFPLLGAGCNLSGRGSRSLRVFSWMGCSLSLSLVALWMDIIIM